MKRDKKCLTRIYRDPENESLANHFMIWYSIPMNIFRVSNDPAESAQQLCDKHIVKMPSESGLMLSTAHRVLDGVPVKRLSKTGKRVLTYYTHPDDDILYKAAYCNHPSTLWTRESRANYLWHYNFFIAMCEEYTYRYGRVHGTQIKLAEYLATPPKNIPDIGETPLRLAMKAHPECEVPGDAVTSYRNFYVTKEFSMIWTKRKIPDWFALTPPESCGNVST